MINSHKLKYICEIDGIDYYLFTPTFGVWFFRDWDGFAEDIEKQSRKQQIRMLLEWFWGGYHIYYGAIHDELVGYVLVAAGGRRIVDSTKKDIVVGPYYTLKDKRGNRYMTKMIGSVLHHLERHYQNAYCYIKKSNLPSIRVASNCGFVNIGQAEMRGSLKKLFLTENDDSRFYIFKYRNGVMSDT